MSRAIARIFVGIEPEAPRSIAAVRAATDLAAALHAELVGIVVENLNLLRSAELPIVRELDVLTAKERSCTRTSIELSLQTRSHRARRAFESVVRKTDVRWSFEVRRCSLLSSAPRSSGRSQRTICVVFEDDSPWKSLVDIATRLARKGEDSVELVYSSEAHSRLDELGPIEDQLRRLGLETRRQLVTRRTDLGAFLSRCSAIVLPSASEQDELPRLVATTGAAVVLLGADEPPG